MYLNHFQLKEMPFSLTPDTQFFFGGKNYREALNTLTLAIKSLEGFVKVVGEVGTGKTMLCRTLLQRLGNNYITAYIPNPYLNPEELKAYLAMEIGAEVKQGQPAHEVLIVIYRRLLQLARQNKQVILVIDEAQAMPRDTIEALRLLTNLETEKRKLLQVVLFGQPELDKLLDRPDLRQLKQRIVYNEYLYPLSFHGLAAYTYHRLQAAGYPVKKHLFSHSALKKLYSASGGIPRLANILAHKAMLAAFGDGCLLVEAKHIKKAMADTKESRAGLLDIDWNSPWFWTAAGTFCLAGVGFVGYWLGHTV